MVLVNCCDICFEVEECSSMEFGTKMEHIECIDEVDNFANGDSTPIFGAYDSDDITAMVEGLHVQLHKEVKAL